MYSPVVVVYAVRSPWSAGDVTVIVTPGSAAPSGPVTLPSNVAVCTPWAKSIDALAMSRRTTRKSRESLRTIRFLLMLWHCLNCCLLGFGLPSSRCTAGLSNWTTETCDYKRKASAETDRTGKLQHQTRLNSKCIEELQCRIHKIGRGVQEKDEHCIVMMRT